MKTVLTIRKVIHDHTYQIEADIKPIGLINCTDEFAQAFQKLLDAGEIICRPTSTESSMMDVWDFVTRFYPDYDHANEIAWNDDLHKLMYEDYSVNDDDCAYKTLQRDYNGDRQSLQLQKDYWESTSEIYREAIESFLQVISRPKSAT